MTSGPADGSLRFALPAVGCMSGSVQGSAVWVRFGWSLKLLHHVKPVRLAPTLDDLALGDAQDVDASELHPALRRRDAQLTAFVGADAAPADHRQIAVVQHGLDLGGQVGENREVHTRQPVESIDTRSWAW